jgi:hypothetical protein
MVNNKGDAVEFEISRLPKGGFPRPLVLALAGPATEYRENLLGLAPR